MRLCAVKGHAMNFPLLPHPDSPRGGVDAIAVHAARGSTLTLQYVSTGDLERLTIPQPQAAQRADELWNSTCFEAFLRATGENGYLEFNFAPSRLWAAYSFAGYREGMHDLTIPAPAISVTCNERELVLQAHIVLENISCLPRNSVWQVGLSAIIEEPNGRKSYWALRHPPGKPDFHHPDCFALELPPP